MIKPLIKILILIPNLENVEKDKIRIAKQFISQTENEINKKGGIGELNIVISMTESPDYVKEKQINFSPEPDIIIGHDEPRWFHYHPNFMNYFPGLFLSKFDPVVPIHSERVFDLTDKLSDNRASLAFFAQALKPKAILFFQHPELITDAAKRRYKEKLKEVKWNGSFEMVALSEDDQETIEEYDNHLISDQKMKPNGKLQKLVRRLKNKIEKLPDGSVVALNNPAFNLLISDLEDIAIDKHFWIFDLTDTYAYSCFLTKTINDDIRIPKLINQFCEQNSIKSDEVLGDLVFLHELLMPIFLCSESAKFSKHKYETPQDVFEQLPVALNTYDGHKNMFVKHGFSYAFKNNKNIAPPSTVALFRTYVRELNDYEEIYFAEQPSLENKIKKTVFAYIDIKRVEEINVTTGTWNVDFELEVNAPFSDPERKIVFSNKALKENSIWSIRTVRESSDEDKEDPRHQTKYRINGTFDFSPEISQFPFDLQTIYIDMALQKEAEDHYVLQPQLKSLIDKEFTVDGWKLISANSGTITEKNMDRLGSTGLETNVYQSTAIRSEWKIARTNNLSVQRSLTPLLVLILLSWHSSFFEYSELISTIEINTTVFLAGVALYFSAEKPQGDRYTYIDKLFMSFYVAIGTLILSEFSILINQKTYNLIHALWQIVIPLLLVILLLNYYSKIRNIARLRTNKFYR